MFYEIRTYTLATGGVPAFERAFGGALEHRTKHSRLGAFFHTELGPLSEVVHIWPYDDLNQRQAVRAGLQDEPNWPPPHDATFLAQESWICNPAPFMRPWEDNVQELGAVYEMRIYTYRPGTMPTVIERFAEAIPHREKYSPLAGAWYTEMGPLNRWIHLWPYASLDERARVRAEAATDPHWPPKTRELLLTQESKILIPAPFSPMR